MFLKLAASKGKPFIIDYAANKRNRLLGTLFMDKYGQFVCRLSDSWQRN